MFEQYLNLLFNLLNSHLVYCLTCLYVNSALSILESSRKRTKESPRRSSKCRKVTPEHRAGNISNSKNPN